MPDYLALVEVDQRQNFILRADKLREMLGASRLIEETREVKADLPVKMVWPVSGVLWLISSDLSALSKALQETRRDFQENGLSATFVVDAYSEDTFTEHLKKLERGMRTRKDTKSGEDGAPRCPLFAQCNIQGALAANIWRPDERRDSHRSRRLVSNDSDIRLRKAKDYAQNIRNRFDPVRHYRKKLQDLDDLVISDSDSYTALIKADGDGLGRLLPLIIWEVLAAELKLETSTQAAYDFSTGLQTVVDKAVKDAVDEVIRQDTNRKKKTCFPILPLVAAGDDLWILCRRDLAFPLVRALGRGFTREAHSKNVLTTACRLFWNNQPLTMSFGLLFAKKGFPFDAQLELAEELEREAKDFRRTLPTPAPGCVDYHWLESSGRESIKAARTAGYSITDNGHTFRLTSRPWTLEQTEMLLIAAGELSAIPRRKRHQLDAVLRYGDQLSDLAYTRWQDGLIGKELDALKASIGALPEELRPRTGPWFPHLKDNRTEYRSALPDLAELAEIVAP